MTRENIQELLAMVQAMYPNYKPENLTATVNAWTVALEDYSANEVAKAFKVYMRTNTSGFAPVAGQLIEIIEQMKSPAELNDMEAWSLVLKAIGNSTYNSVEEFAKLPPLVQKAVGQPETLRQWAMTEDLNMGVAMTSFQKAYRTEVARNRDFAKMPADVRGLIENTCRNDYKAQIEQRNTDVINSSLGTKESEIKALEAKIEGVEMPEHLREKLKNQKS